MAFDPIPVPVRGSATFNADAEAFAQGMSQFATDYNALSSVIDASLTSTSTTSLTIGTGSKVLTVQAGLGYVVGYPLRISSSASPTNYMDGIVTDYNTGTGSLTVNVLSVSGSGTIAAWNTMVLPGGGNFASLSYNKFTQRQVFSNEVSIASASTIDFTAGNSNQFLITGTTSITAVTIEQGAVIKARFAAACTLTHGTNLQVQGGTNFTTAAGDIATFTSNGTVVRVEISRLNGRSVVQTDIVNLSNDSGLTEASPDKAASPEWVNAKSLLIQSAVTYLSGLTVADINIPSGVKSFTLIGESISLSSTEQPWIQLGTASGAATSGYTGGRTTLSANTVDLSVLSSSFPLRVSSAGGFTDCCITFYNIVGTNKWVTSYTNTDSSGRSEVVSGHIDLASALTFVRLVRSGASATFDGGSLMAVWQY